jgi:hypothetical protein
MLERSRRRTVPLRRLELFGYSIVAIGFGLVILGILEIGGMFSGSGSPRWRAAA